MIKQRATLCYTIEAEGYLEQLKKRFPGAKTHFLDGSKFSSPIDRTHFLLDSISDVSSPCKVGMLPSKFITQVEMDGSFCPFERLGDELLEIRSGMVLSSDRACIIPTLDALISLSHSESD